MNERIEKPALQAGFSKDKYDLYWDEDANAEGVDLEKFAQLIVKETCNIILHYDNVDEGVAVANKQLGVEL